MQFRNSILFLLPAIALLGGVGTAVGQERGPVTDTIRVYGPGGPLPAMREAAAEFGSRRGVHVEVVGGPTPQWLAKARGDADVIFAGSGHMMADFIMQLDSGTAGRLDPSTIHPLYLRPVAILVRKGNPRGISRFEDLLQPGVRVLVVQGSGQTGLWEDVAGRTGDIEVVRAFRRNIAAMAPNTGIAKDRWTADTTLNAWLVWNIWQIANPELADLVPIREPWLIYRGTGVALTHGGRTKPLARGFAEFLSSADAARIFQKWGWITEAPNR
ncbi:AcfC family putative adhesin [soil metagenome]